MKLIQSLAWFLQDKGATEVRMLDYSGLDFFYLGEKFDLNIETLSHQASLSVSVFVKEQMEDENLGEDDVLSVINELCKQSSNITYYYEHESQTAYGRYSFNYTNFDKLTFWVLNACNALVIAKETFLRVAAGSRVDAHLDWSFIYCEDEESNLQTPEGLPPSEYSLCSWIPFLRTFGNIRKITQTSAAL